MYVEIMFMRHWKWNKIRPWNWNTTLTQRHKNIVKHCYVVSTLVQCSLNPAKARSKPVGLLMSMDLKIIWLMINNFYSASWESIVYNILTVQLLTAVRVVIHIGNKGEIRISLKHCDFETSKQRLKIWKNKINALYIL